TELARARRFDGLVLLGGDTDRVAVAALLVAKIPAVHVGRRVIGQYDLPYVTPDYHSAGKLGAKRLLDRGAHRIVYVAGVKQPESRADLLGGIEAAVAEERARGGEMACATLDVYEIEELDEKLAVEAGVGIFAHGTKLGMAVWYLLQKRGQGVPLTIYDDEGWLGEALPQVDWIRPRQRLMGYQAALLTLALIRGQSLPARHLAIAPEISWRREAGDDGGTALP
ncbi:MAG: substrate-binding domain-containing protein, partial [Chloroflexi bacterium]|nr:substrate-binding domain-containing protein [Chloroflexota bacterium]